ncbi:MarC family protein [Halothiobacillus sp. DCM-1]|uniref:MarC family protein n=1 Tax=Halothiobacillus sp. DCM-1 TaxID=3112558 RepID=UPI00324B5DCC
MTDLVHHALTVFMAFFAIMNPIANSVIFLSLTSNLGIRSTRRVALRALRVAFGIVLVFALFGSMVFALFGVTLAALRIAGGVLIALVGYRMLHGEHSLVSHPAALATADGASEPEGSTNDVAITPLAIPVLAGPGTIATTMSYAPSGQWILTGITIAMFFLICVITYLAFVFSEQILARIGRDGMAVITRLMGLILAVIGVQMLLMGIQESGVLVPVMAH